MVLVITLVLTSGEAVALVVLKRDGPNPGPGGAGGNGYPNPDFAAPHVAPALTTAGVPQYLQKSLLL